MHVCCCYCGVNQSGVRGYCLLRHSLPRVLKSVLVLAAMFLCNEYNFIYYRIKRDITTRLWAVDETEGRRSRPGKKWKQGIRGGTQGDLGTPLGEPTGEDKAVRLDRGGEEWGITGSYRDRGHKKRFLPTGPLPEGPPRDFFRRRSSPGRGDGVKDPGR